MTLITLDGHTLSPQIVFEVAHQQAQVALSSSSASVLTERRRYIDQLAKGSTPIYGLNTGFGALAEKRIQETDIAQLQLNLILSHAVGVGTPLSIPQARALMLLRTNTLALGHSGCRALLLEHMVTLLNAGCAPYVPSRGSVGASGDLAPLSHLALLLLGVGNAYYQTELLPAKTVLEKAGLRPIQLEAKEGLALINGTQAMTALGALSVVWAQQLCQLATTIGACTLVAMQGSTAPFDARIQAVRAHPGQIAVAAHLRALLEGYQPQRASRVQDAYSLRCMPQVHGASQDVVSHVEGVLEREMNSATDNPLVFDAENSICMLSGGNFHGQPVALALDYLAMAVAELANISERRIEQLLNPALSNGLPAFLSPNPGLNSGYMMLQVTASALVNENKVLCHPASTDSIPTSAGREDHVSMGMTAANKLGQILENVHTTLAIEAMCALQALHLREAPLPGQLKPLYQAMRNHIPFAEQDRLFGADLAVMQTLLETLI